MRLRDLYENENKIEKTWQIMGRDFITRLGKDNSFLNGQPSMFVTNIMKAIQDNNTGALRELYNKPIRTIIEVDPTPERQSSYLPWIVRLYTSGGIRLWEDLGRTKIALEQYHDMKTRRVFQNSDDPKIKKAGDINQFRSLSDLESFMRELVNRGGDQSIADRNFIKKLSEFISNSGVVVEKMNNDKTIGIIQIKSYEASSLLFKQRTSWCTTTDDELFGHYSPLIVYYDLNTDYYEQLSLSDFTHMDKNDTPFNNVKSTKLYDYIKQYVNQDPLYHVNNSVDALQYIDDPSEEVQMVAVKKNGYAIMHIDDPSEEVQMVAVQKSVKAIEYIKNPTRKAKELYKKLMG